MDVGIYTEKYFGENFIFGTRGGEHRFGEVVFNSHQGAMISVYVVRNKKVTNDFTRYRIDDIQHRIDGGQWKLIKNTMDTAQRQMVTKFSVGEYDIVNNNITAPTNLMDTIDRVDGIGVYMNRDKDTLNTIRDYINNGDIKLL